jgi:hypothetical protein
MTLSLRRGTVTAIAEEHEGLVRCEVDGKACVAYPELTGAIAVGDEVVVNVQAWELELGSGGFDVLHLNLTRGLDLSPPPGAHVMKLPYTAKWRPSARRSRALAWPTSRWRAERFRLGSRTRCARCGNEVWSRRPSPPEPASAATKNA